MSTAEVERAIEYERQMAARRAGETLVYVFDADHGTKVGITIQTLEARLSDLTRAAGFEATVVAAFAFAKNEDARRVEKLAHWLLRDTRTVGEWFHCHPLEAVDAVRRATRGGGLFLQYLQWQDAQRKAA